MRKEYFRMMDQEKQREFENMQRQLFEEAKTQRVHFGAT